jgi:uncharacterized protein (TIGR02452 family)
LATDKKRLAWKKITVNRDKRTILAKQTLSILEAGSYRAPSGNTVSLAEPMKAALEGTQLYRPADFPENLTPATRREGMQTRIEITGETTLEAAQRVWVESGEGILILNFASAKNPGGGFLNGSQAQEESLARSSGLYPCLLQAREMYDYHRELGTCLYSDHMIYTPDVPVFRDDAGTLLEAPYCVSFISSPAVNAGAVRRNEPEKVALIEPTLRERMRKILWLATEHHYRTLILGAWGCGVFQNEPATVARLFSEWLRPGAEYGSSFERIVFAIYDRTETQEVLKAFRAVGSMRRLQ